MELLEAIGQLLCFGLCSAIVLGLVAVFFAKRRSASKVQPTTTSHDDDAARRPCPRCGYDLRASGDRCPECGVFLWNRKRYMRRLAHEWPSNAVECRKVVGVERPVPLLRTLLNMEAELLNDQLIWRGIASYIENVETHDVLLGTRSIRGNIVYVFEGDQADAVSYLRRIRGIPEGLSEGDIVEG